MTVDVLRLEQRGVAHRPVLARRPDNVKTRAGGAVTAGNRASSRRTACHVEAESHGTSSTDLACVRAVMFSGRNRGLKHRRRILARVSREATLGACPKALGCRVCSPVAKATRCRSTRDRHHRHNERHLLPIRSHRSRARRSYAPPAESCGYSHACSGSSVGHHPPHDRVDSYSDHCTTALKALIRHAWSSRRVM